MFRGQSASKAISYVLCSEASQLLSSSSLSGCNLFGLDPHVVGFGADPKSTLEALKGPRITSSEEVLVHTGCECGCLFLIQ